METIHLYNVTVAYSLCQFIAIPLLGRSRRPSSTQVRPGSDATWFLGVYFWGFQSVYALANMWGGLCLTGETGHILEIVFQIMSDDYIVPGLVMFLTVLAASFSAERFARHQGLPTRSRDAGVPPGVVAALLCVQFAWAGCLAMGLNR